MYYHSKGSMRNIIFILKELFDYLSTEVLRLHSRQADVLVTWLWKGLIVVIFKSYEKVIFNLTLKFERYLSLFIFKFVIHALCVI